MGLQATAATKRKHDLTFDSKDTNTYTNCPPPIKTSKWSLNNNNYNDAVEEQKATATMNSFKTNNRNNNNNNENKNCNISCSTMSYSLRNGKEVLRTKVGSSKPVLNAIVANIPAAGEVDATTPLPPTSSTPVPEDSIAKLEVVANVPWTSAPEPVDCISKLQAVAVPSDPWGSISTRSTLATTLLSADELDDDDDDFEDDYEEEESIIPTYCPLRYHTFPSSNASTTNHQSQQRMNSSFTTSQSYNSRPNYYSEPFPQQNCSRTGSPQHLRVGNGFSWQSSNGNNTSFYSIPETSYTPSPQQHQQTQPQLPPQPQQQQQTIRCAENGKSYLELGCSSPVLTMANNSVQSPSPSSFAGIHVAAPPTHEARMPIKRCCDGRGTWCSANKSCYKDIRLKIRNLSMFKLSRFRQVSEQSLYRSVLICNTLKRIDREIETETKELHQAAAHVAQQHHNHLSHSTTHHQSPTQYHQLHSHMQIQSPLSPHNSNNNNGHHHQLPQQQLHSQQPILHTQHQDYMPAANSGRLGGSIEYQNQQQQQQSTSQQNFQQHHHYQNERLEISSFQNSMQKSPANSSQFTNNQCSNSCPGSVTITTLHPYDHYPFREAHSGRATPFPSQPVISIPPVSAPVSTSTTSQVQSPVAPLATSTTTVSTLSSTTSDTDSGYADDDSTRSINWSSVLSLSSQSALDPLNNNDLFSILPPVNPATAVPVSIPSSSSARNGSDTNFSSSMAVAISGTFTTVQSSSAPSSATTSTSSNTSIIPPSATTTATFTTLSTISSATHSLTSSYVSSMSSNSASASSSWEYGFLDMDFGLGTEFTELAPSCKLSSEEFGFKNGLTPVTVTRYDNELEQPAHIMVGS